MQVKSQTISPFPATFSTTQVISAVEKGQETTMTTLPLPASPGVMLFSSQSFSTQNPIIFIVLKNLSFSST